MKKCPFLNQACLQEKCQLWVQVNKGKECAIAAIPLTLKHQLDSIESHLHKIAASTIRRQK